MGQVLQVPHPGRLLKTYRRDEDLSSLRHGFEPQSTGCGQGDRWYGTGTVPYLTVSFINHTFTRLKFFYFNRRPTNV